MMSEEESRLSMLQRSVAETGRRCFKVEPSVYTQLSASVDQARGYPHGIGSKALTVRGLPIVDQMPISNDGSGFVLVSLEVWRFIAADDEMIQPAIDAGLIEELTQREYIALKPEVEV